MGRNKLLLPVGVETVLRRAARTALAADLRPLVVVLGHEAERAERELAGLDCKPIVHVGYRDGIAGSLAAGIAALPAETDAMVVLLADMPRVTPEMISALVSRHREDGASVVVSDYDGVQAPPTLFARALFAELTSLRGDRGGSEVARRHRASAAFVRWPADRLRDLDLPSDREQSSDPVSS